MNIAMFAWGAHPSTNYRALHPMTELSRRGHLVAMYGEPEALTPTDEEIEMLASDFDVAFIARYTEPEAAALARRLADRGMALVWDFDDDVVRPERIAGLEAMVEVVDVVTTTNETLAERYRERGARRTVAIPNYLTRPSLAASRRKHEGIVLGYIGWVDHQDDWDELGLEETLLELLDVHPDLRVESVGPIDLRLPEDRYRSIGVLPFDRLPDAIAGFDVAIAPLIDKPGNATRSDIKLKEYAIGGVPWLASPLGPYAQLGEEQGGRLVEDDAWFEAINDMLLDGRGRKKLAKRGTKWALSQTLASNVGEWAAALDEAVELAERRRAAV